MKRQLSTLLCTAALLALITMACKDKNPTPNHNKVNLLVEARNLGVNTYKFYYNDKKQVISAAIYPKVGTKDSTWFKYNAQGLVVRRYILKQSAQVDLTYDNQNRVIQEVLTVPGTGGFVSTFAYTYDDNKVTRSQIVSSTITDSTVYTIANGNLQTAYGYRNGGVVNKRDNQEFDNKPSVNKMLPSFLWAIPYVMPNKNNLKKFRYEVGDMSDIYEGISVFTYNDTLAINEEHDYRYIDNNTPSPVNIEYFYEKR